VLGGNGDKPNLARESRPPLRQKGTEGKTVDTILPPGGLVGLLRKTGAPKLKKKKQRGGQGGEHTGARNAPLKKARQTPKSIKRATRLAAKRGEKKPNQTRKKDGRNGAAGGGLKGGT